MPYPIEKKLVVAVSSTALFELEVEDEIYKSEGMESYRKYQIENKDKIIPKGLAFPFIRRFLNINKSYTDEKPVEVVLLSKNSPECGIRIMNSIKYHKLEISRATFTSGDTTYKYIPSFNVSLFLSTNKDDVLNAINSGFPGGQILKSKVQDDEEDNQLRIAFDFDGVIADDESEKVYGNDNLDLFHQHEEKNVGIPHNPGPLSDFFKKISYFQKLESKKYEKNPKYNKILKTAIITARNAPSHERAINTLGNWGVTVDEMIFLGGIDKKRILEVFKPQLFIDDQISHLDTSLKDIPLVHIPFGIKNKN